LDTLVTLGPGCLAGVNYDFYQLQINRAWLRVWEVGFYFYGYSGEFGHQQKRRSVEGLVIMQWSLEELFFNKGDQFI